jgi:hypothetical protein
VPLVTLPFFSTAFTVLLAAKVKTIPLNCAVLSSVLCSKELMTQVPDVILVARLLAAVLSVVALSFVQA